MLTRSSSTRLSSTGALAGRHSKETVTSRNIKLLRIVNKHIIRLHRRRSGSLLNERFDETLAAEEPQNLPPLLLNSVNPNSNQQPVQNLEIEPTSLDANPPTHERRRSRSHRPGEPPSPDPSLLDAVHQNPPPRHSGTSHDPPHHPVVGPSPNLLVSPVVIVIFIILLYVLYISLGFGSSSDECNDVIGPII